ncbi:MAG: oligosaccharide flippase family protein [Alistipes sp.]|nr:oligosaccharide flippase family protein [Alistipes sp.]
MSFISKLIAKIRQSAIAKDSSWAIIGSAIGKGASMLTGVIIARLLGAEIYGEYGMVKSTLAYVAVFSTFGLGYTTTKHIAQCRKNDFQQIRSIIRDSLTITLITSGLMAVLLLLFAQYITSEPHLVPTLRYTALIVIFNAINTTQLGLLSGFKDFRTIAINNTVTGIATLLLGTSLTYYIGLDGAVMALFIATALQCLLNHIAVRGHAMRIKKLAETSEEKPQKTNSIRELLRFSLPIALQECVYASANWIKMLILIHLAGYDELGLYTASNQWFVMILFIPGVLRNVILSHLSSSIDDTAKHKNTFSTMLKINAIATLIPAIGIALLSPLIDLFYGDSFHGLVPVLLIMVVTSVFGCIANIYTQEFISRGRTWTIFWGYVLREYGSLIIVTPFIMQYGQQFGAALMYSAVLIMHIVYCSVLHYKYNKEFKRV